MSVTSNSTATDFVHFEYIAAKQTRVKNWGSRCWYGFNLASPTPMWDSSHNENPNPPSFLSHQKWGIAHCSITSPSSYMSDKIIDIYCTNRQTCHFVSPGLLQFTGVLALTWGIKFLCSSLLDEWCVVQRNASPNHTEDVHTFSQSHWRHSYMFVSIWNFWSSYLIIIFSSTGQWHNNRTN
jgi:hypothetical protein